MVYLLPIKKWMLTCSLQKLVPRLRITAENPGPNSQDLVLNIPNMCTCLITLLILNYFNRGKSMLYDTECEMNAGRVNRKFNITLVRWINIYFQIIVFFKFFDRSQFHWKIRFGIKKFVHLLFEIRGGTACAKLAISVL